MDDITIRDLGPADVDDLHAIAQHWSVVRQLGGWPWPADRAFTASRSTPYTGRGFVWGLERDGRIVGSMAITRAELGYMLHPDVWGQGIATRIARRAIAHAFATDDLDWIDASVWADNAASAHVLRKLGFTHWQTRFEHARARGHPAQAHHFRLTRRTHDGLRMSPKWRNSAA